MSYPSVALRDISEDTRKHMPEEDFAGKGRSFPIETPDDVHNAAQSIGQAGDDNYSSGTLKANIKRIAKRKGAAFETRLPESWKDEGKEIAACDVQMSDRGPRLVVRLGDVAAGVVKRIPLAKLGSFVKGNQKFSITKKTLADVVANFHARKADTVIDYEHASEFPEEAQGGPIPAAGWLKQIESAPDNEGVLWGSAEFTPRAQQMIAQKEYRYLSPVIDWGARDKATGEPQGATLTSVALTNRPFLEAMPALVASDRARGFGRGAAEGRSSKTVKVILADRAAKTVRIIADDDTEQTLAVEGLEAQPRVLRLSDVKRDAEGRLDFAALANETDALVASEVFRAHQAQAELDQAVQKGLITPAQRPHFEKMALSDLPGFRELAKTMKPQVDLSERGLGGGAEGAREIDKVTRELEGKVAEKQKANPKLQYHEALKLVASENPTLNKRYTELSRRAMTGREE